MKSKSVDTITSDEEHIRLRIFDGELPVDKFYEELSRFWKRKYFDLLMAKNSPKEFVSLVQARVPPLQFKKA